MLPNEIYLDEDFLTYEMTETLLNAVEIDQARNILSYFFYFPNNNIQIIGIRIEAPAGGLLLQGGPAGGH